MPGSGEPWRAEVETEVEEKVGGASLKLISLGNSTIETIKATMTAITGDAIKVMIIDYQFYERCYL